MRTRSSSNLVGESSPNPTTSNPKRRNRRHSKQPFSLEESPVDTMADQRTMAELLRAPTEGYAKAIVVPPILAENFELKHSLINMMTSDQFFRLEKDNPHDHIRCGLVLHGPSVPMPLPFINPEEDERTEETLTDPELAEYTIKIPPPLVQKAKPTSLKNYVVHKRDPLNPDIPYPLRMHQEKQQEKDKVQIHKIWQMFKQLHINISLADALILIPKYQKMLKSLLSNKEKLLELENTPLNENCSAVILKKLPEKLGDPGKFLIPCGFSELKCKALADLGASINLMPLSVGKFTFPADFVIVDYESDPRFPLILGRPFLRTAHTLIDVHGAEKK
ncbi:reverse transcriptase domain-containing protein [Tanacetum coccineum]